MAFPLDSRRNESSAARFVDRLVRHGDPMPARDLLSRVVTAETRYLVFDLDRTLYFQRNIGELLGWEVCAHDTYGPELMAELESSRPPGRFLLDPARPLDGLRYLARGAATWAYPGLYYLLWGRIVPHFTALARHRYARFGVEPHRRVQAVPSIALLHDLASFDLETLRGLTQSVLQRHADDQVISPEDISWLKARFPALTIILSSASPQPVVQATAEHFGIDHYEHTTLEVQDGRLSAPHQLHPLFYAPRLPPRLCPPAAMSLNSGHEKVARLTRRFPDLLDPGTETVGITDTSHDEDHAWAAYMTRVVDINSPTPFPVLIPEASPLSEIHSAQLLTRAERDAGTRDARRAALPVARESSGVFDAADLGARLASARGEVDRLTRDHDGLALELANQTAELDGALREAGQGVARAVRDYNAAGATARLGARRTLVRQLRAEARLTRARDRALEPMARLRYELDRVATTSRAALLGVAAPAALPSSPAHS